MMFLPVETEDPADRKGKTVDGVPAFNCVGGLFSWLGWRGSRKAVCLLGFRNTPEPIGCVLRPVCFAPDYRLLTAAQSPGQLTTVARWFVAYVAHAASW